MDNKTYKSTHRKNYLPSTTHMVVEDKTHIDTDGNMQEEPTVKDILNDKIEPPPPRTPSL